MEFFTNMRHNLTPTIKRANERDLVEYQGIIQEEFNNLSEKQEEYEKIDGLLTREGEIELKRINERQLEIKKDLNEINGVFSLLNAKVPVELKETLGEKEFEKERNALIQDIFVVFINYKDSYDEGSEYKRSDMKMFSMYQQHNEIINYSNYLSDKVSKEIENRKILGQKVGEQNISSRITSRVVTSRVFN